MIVMHPDRIGTVIGQHPPRIGPQVPYLTKTGEPYVTKTGEPYLSRTQVAVPIPMHP